ncbi:GNAT family N-acetyltransferase [Streptomyces sp. NPDC016845]|uniref:GNAT family N-acetyltransferase n=1 Tax=Streptomyces sp. NPDC016845 TaxID=3364972 RepID=UPI0037AA7F09
MSQQPPLVRFAVLDDDEALSRLDRDTWSSLHAVVEPPAPPHPPFFSGRLGPRDHLVAELHGRVVGYIRLARPTPLPSNAHVRQVQGLAVATAARGHGVGRTLVRAAVEESRRQGARRITLRVLGHNTPARTLYEAEGFVVEGVLPGEFLIDGEYVDDVCMGRSLLGGARRSAGAGDS